MVSGNVFGKCALALSFAAFIYQSAHAQEGQDQLASGLSALNGQDYGAASEYFADAFKAGQADGAFYLGRMLELGLGSAPDLKAAIALYLAGSAKASAPAKNRLGVLHIQGTGVLQDFEQGAQLICEAAELGDPNGAYNCASLLLEGKGVGQDEAAAYDWFKTASDLGHLGARNEYANALIEGKYVEQDIPGAVQLFQQTAAEGNPVGLYSLGQAFAVGIGVDQSLVKAHSYFNLAAALNHPLAAEARARLEPDMSDEDIRAAQQLAKAWRPNAPEQEKE
ncbi:sel1 repeat family protein [Maritimibacter sp. 55A14]|uniref:tetratricopeptide repeat protein n=1 Tax=Maritimibacter sp. 55A14 TaxID=2174844 RepID=UPI000D603C54|nr:tetratricopeptide repeat protein [Maritimibacter sp. 55A14]PWE34099.1 sel1 repeat family protein [Maritimibacter sp. 55A14]